TLTAEGVTRREPDGFLWELWSFHPQAVALAVESVRAEAERLSGTPQPTRSLLKRAKLPRLAKALGS
ncbi:MAG: PIN domain-containing protein, partial [Paracoccaceae bacterium]